jgi:transposase
MEQQSQKMQRFTFKDFDRMFADDAACLEWLRNFLYPDGIFCSKCNAITKHHRVVSRPSYSCDQCGHHVHPMAGTIFHKSSTSLKTWFHAIYLMASTRCGISAKQIERETGVTYKTAWRMFKQIRTLLDEDRILSGAVEADETYFGGHHNGGGKKRGRGTNKAAVFGIVERKGRIMAKVVEDISAKTLVGTIHEKVLPMSTVYTDEYPSYNTVPGERQYHHKRIHHATKIWVRGDVHTNTIEGFWSLLKRGIGGVYHSVSHKYLQTYLDEYTFRYSHRHDIDPMFLTFLRQIAKSEVAR